jgi:hypothetical protein
VTRSIAKTKRQAREAEREKQIEVSESDVLPHWNFFAACAARLSASLAEQKRTALGFVGLIAVLAAIVVLVVELIHMFARGLAVRPILPRGR